MSNHEFENYMALVSRLLRLNRNQQQTIRDELRDHLEFRVADLVETGLEHNEAVRKALEEFGDAASLAHQFQSIFKSNQKRWIMRFATFSIALSFVAAVMIMAMWPSPARFGSPSSAHAVQDQNPFTSTKIDSSPNSAAKAPTKTITKVMTSVDIDQILNKPVDFDYDEVPFADVMEDLQSDFRFNTHLDVSAKDDSLAEDTSVQFRIKNARMATALRLMLAEFNATYMIDDGIMRIISLDVAVDPEFHRRKVFDCDKLLEKIDSTDPRIGQPLMPSEGVGGGMIGGGGRKGGGGIFSVPPQATTEPAAEANNQTQKGPMQGELNSKMIADLLGGTHDSSPKIDASYLLRNLVIKTVSADSWAETNGDGTLSMIGGLMVVNQSQEALDKIEKLLGELEKRMK